MTEELPIRVLLVEDNVLDAKATLRAAERLKLANAIDHVTDGIAALEYLHRDRSAGPRPDLILLDLSLPGRDGREVLEDIKRDPELRRIPVVILTTSAEESDIVRAYELGANAYVTKPIGLEGWQEVVSRIEGFWFSLVKIPPT